MKRSLKVLLLLVLFSPLVASAATVKLDCPETAKAGSNITCGIKLSSNDIVDGFEANISTSSGITYKDYTRAKGWSGTSSNSTFLVFGYVDEENNRGIKGDNIVLGTYTYKVESSATGNLIVTLSNIIVSDAEGESLSSNQTVSDTIKVASSINTLSNLSISGASIDFSSDVTTYNVEIDSATTIISATATDSYAKVSGTGNKTLKYGTNKFEIVVTAENGSTKTYTINVTRKDNRSTDSTLKELKLNNGTINFKSGTTTYNVTIDSDTTTISATANDAKAKISGVGIKKLNYGVNKFEIIVTAENGSAKTYTLNITRTDTRNTNNNLSSLTLSAGRIDFDKNKTNYELSVKNDISEITIDGKTEDSKSKAEGFGTKKLEVGKNTFTIKVTAENESVKEYKIVVIREEKETITANNSIKNLTVTGHEIEFDAATKEYVIETNKKTLDIKVELESSESTYKIIGNEDLHDGSIIQIVVTDKDGNNNIYTITIENPNEDIIEDEEQNPGTQEEKDINYIPIIMMIILGVLIVANIYLLIKQIRKNKNSV